MSSAQGYTAYHWQNQHLKLELTPSPMLFLLGHPLLNKELLSVHYVQATALTHLRWFAVVGLLIMTFILSFFTEGLISLPTVPKLIQLLSLRDGLEPSFDSNIKLLP